jgi:hypothetical protein
VACVGGCWPGGGSGWLGLGPAGSGRLREWSPAEADACRRLLPGGRLPDECCRTSCHLAGGWVPRGSACVGMSRSSGVVTCRAGGHLTRVAERAVPSRCRSSPLRDDSDCVGHHRFTGRSWFTRLGFAIAVVGRWLGVAVARCARRDASASPLPLTAGWLGSAVARCVQGSLLGASHVRQVGTGCCASHWACVSADLSAVARRLSGGGCHSSSQLSSSCPCAPSRAHPVRGSKRPLVPVRTRGRE